MNFFNPTPANLQELRTMYKTLAFRFHPDIHPELSGDEMKAINTQYEDLSKILAHETKFEESELHFSDLYKDIIEALLKLSNIKIEIIGNWIWVTGDTRTNKEALKALKFNYAPKKQAWFFKSYTYHKKSKEELSLDDIKNYYGSKTVKNTYRNPQPEDKQPEYLFN